LKRSRQGRPAQCAILLDQKRSARCQDRRIARGGPPSDNGQAGAPLSIGSLNEPDPAFIAARADGGQTADDSGSRRLHGGVGSPEGDSACQGSRTGSHGMTVIAAPYDPMPILLSDNLADVVAPYDDRPDRRPTCVDAVVSPSDGSIVLRPRVTAHLPAHVPAAPRSRPA